MIVTGYDEAGSSPNAYEWRIEMRIREKLLKEVESVLGMTLRWVWNGDVICRQVDKVCDMAEWWIDSSAAYICDCSRNGCGNSATVVQSKWSWYGVQFHSVESEYVRSETLPSEEWVNEMKG